ncbi:hypothetical protein DTQ70_16870 [Runella sp. SP2]|nr:hypothetical protein DTQ70_16870 [Runella sp. SP2]
MLLELYIAPIGGWGQKKIVTVKVKNLDKHAGTIGSISYQAPRVYLDFFVFTVTIQNVGAK